MMEWNIPCRMRKSGTPAPRVTRIEVHYDDGSSDVMTTIPKEGTELPLFSWSRSAPSDPFPQRAYTSTAVATVLFQTALTRRLMPASPMDKDTMELALGFAQRWQDDEYLRRKAAGEEQVDRGQ